MGDSHIIMSGISDHPSVRRLSDVRISGFVPKPFAPDQLAQAVAMVRLGAAKWVGQDRREQNLRAMPDRNGARRIRR